MKEFIAEVRPRAEQGYSTMQLMQSHTPEVGNEVNVAASEVTAALRNHAVAALMFVWGKQRKTSKKIVVGPSG